MTSLTFYHLQFANRQTAIRAIHGNVPSMATCHPWQRAIHGNVPSMATCHPWHVANAKFLKEHDKMTSLTFYHLQFANRQAVIRAIHGTLLTQSF